MTLRAAIVGAGPSGFYTADMLLRDGFEVDLIDSLPTPFGLVRAGVAPDHPKIKSVTRVYEKTAAQDGFRFFGGVHLGTDITREELLQRYHVVVYAMGTSADNRLGIPGEDRPGSHAATEFVAWYNGHPDAADHAFDLECERAVVIGNGNVAIDVARMLVLDPDELALTDTADHAIEALAASQIREVVLLGRRGPAQAAFTNPELRELADLRRASVQIDAADLELDEASRQWLENEADATARKNMEVLRGYAEAGCRDTSHRLVLRFLRSPLEILGDGQDGRVTGIRAAVNRIELDGNGRLRAVGSEESETIQCGLVLRSIGYRGTEVPGVPFDDKRGLIRNDAGRVCNEEREPHTGEYAVGWIKRGPSGVIGTNKKDAAGTVAAIREDTVTNSLNQPTDSDAENAREWLLGAAPNAVDWEGWSRIDQDERTRGSKQGRPRVKLVRRDELITSAAYRPAAAGR